MFSSRIVRIEDKTFLWWILSYFFITIAQDSFAIKKKNFPILRLDHSLGHLKIADNNRFLALTDKDGTKLKIIDLSNLLVHEVAQGKIGPSFIWSPRGFRLIFRELRYNAKNGVKSVLGAYDPKKNEVIILNSWKGYSGYISYDPEDAKLQILASSRILSHRILFPSYRDYRQIKVAAKTKWLPTSKGIIQMDSSGHLLDLLNDDGSGLQSYSICSNGNNLIWSTKMGNIYWKSQDGPIQLVAKGKDPQWHPSKNWIVYAAAKSVGHQLIDYDLKILDLTSKVSRYLTKTQYSKERWPSWTHDSKIIYYTVEKTTDLYRLRVNM